MTPARTRNKRRQTRPEFASGRRVTAAIAQSIKPTSHRWTLAICILLAAVTLSLYGPVIRHPFINYDDKDYVTENQQVRAGLSWHTMVWALTATGKANWHPLTWISHALDCQLYGMDAAGHHLSSILFHVLNTVLLFLLLAQVTRLTVRSAVVAALFALHPLNVESVAWIAERKNVLSMFFFLLALGAYGWYTRQPNWRRYAAVALLFALGLASKPMVITLPCVLLLLDYWPLGRVRGWAKASTIFPVPQTAWARLVAEKVPLLALSAASAIVTVIAQQSGHAVVQGGHLYFQVRAENALYSYAMYVGKVFWPVHLAVFYPHPLDKLTFLQVVFSGLFLIVVCTYVWWERVKRPYLVTGWLWFLGTLVPVIGFIQVGAQGMADRYAYLPTIGLFVMLVWRTGDWAEEHSLSFRTIAPVTVTVLVVLCALTFRQIGYWHSSYDLWTHTLAVTQDNFAANNNLGDLLLGQGRPEAIRYYEAAAAIAPWDPVSHGAVASNLQDHGDFQNAIREYDIVLRANPDPPIQGFTYANLGVIYRELGNYPLAREDSERALSLDSDGVHEMIRQLSEMVAAHPAAPGYLRLGLLQEGAGQFAGARSAYEQALRLNPQFEPARKALEALVEGKQ
jgi:protein O-mannosyl-transferase